MSNRILICRSNPIAPDPRVEKEARSLVRAGYEVQLVGWDRTGVLPTSEDIQGIQCNRLQIKAKYAAGIMNLPALLRWQWGLLKWLVAHRHNYDLIHACDFDTVIPALICRSFFGKLVIYDIFDFYADHLRATPEWIKEIIRLIDYRVINSVDGIILVDDSRWEQIEKTHPKRSIVIYNSPEDFAPTKSRSADNARNKDKAQEDNHFRIVYVGLIQKERGLVELISVFNRHPNWTLELAGFGGDEAFILELLEGMTNIHWFGRIAYEEALDLSRTADVLVATYDPAIPNHRFSSPNKVFEAMMLGKPIIVAENTNMDRIIKEEECGLVVTYGDPQALESAFVNLEMDLGLRNQLGVNARNAYEQKYSWKIMEGKLINFYSELISSTRT